jgi:CheY-like chemotaxis protein/nitrogen-specific signal transduction histidine kinase/HPt (histidine-containing phosphotransfer) domain-containing protein
MHDNQSTSIDKIADLSATVKRLKKQNAQLQKKAIHADSANKAKSDFLAMISHEIRTPMNGVIGLTELLLDNDLDGQQKHFAELILASARNLLTLINSLLDFSKIEARKMVLDLAPFDLKKMLDEIVELYSLSGRQKNLSVAADIDHQLRPSYIGDSYRIRQILVNFLGNAIKFTERGEIRIKVFVNECKDDMDLIRFEVKDTGPGIIREKQGELFQPFAQLDGPSRLRYGGTGLGLSICAKLIELMQGALGLNSEPGQGSTFWFQISLPAEQIGSSGVETTAGLFPGKKQKLGNGIFNSILKYKILIVDDEPTNRMVLREILQRAGVEVVEAVNGLEAVDFCMHSSFDLVFMDCQMPVVDGFESTTKILSMGKETGKKLPPVVALTADATVETQQRCRDTGMVDYLLKPLDFDELKSVVGRLLPGLQQQILGRHVIVRKEDTDIESEPMVVNPKSLEKLGENIGDTAPVIAVFLKTLNSRISEINQAVNARDAKAIARTAHTLKGSSSQFGAEELSGLCRQMEDMGRGNDIVQAASLFFEIERAADRLREALSITSKSTK